jgi:hypothetical protein
MSHRQRRNGGIVSAMVKPIRLRSAEILAQARATLIRGGRGPELEQAHKRAVMERARAILARAEEQNRLKRCAALAAQKAIVAVREAYRRQDQVDGSELERARWFAAQALVLDELTKIVEGRRP